ncbi:MAG: YajQ family cyclic di-GMP-binding protein [Ilumatobacter sp.]|uniref:YajQ family cyclic di-GMP-binding protein n=1 Tax=Ilumatobacter sp. TaxID=1967498 RepID=UPI00329A5DEF
MPSFDVVSEVDEQEVRNAVDQAQREVAQRFDFKNTNSSIELKDLVITMHTASTDRLDALRIVVEEKLVKRGVSLRGVDYGDVQEASQATVRQVMTIAVGISSEKAKLINRTIKEKGPKGATSQLQGDSIRVNAKKRDTLQEVITMLKAESDIGIPLQFQNFRD